MKTIIIDASSAILLFKSGIIAYLLSEYRTFMTQSVHDEITKAGCPGSEEFKEYSTQRKFEIILIKNAAGNRLKDLLNLDKGERDTII